MAKAVRLSDIAEKIGVSNVTVSKALSGQPGVSDAVREQIIQTADEMGYVSTKAAKNAENAKSLNIGVLIHENYLERYASLYWEMYQNVTMYAMNKKHFTLLEVISEQMEQEHKIPNLVEEKRVDGLVIIGKLNEDYRKKVIVPTHVPKVYMDFSDESRKADSVVSDSYYGAYRMTEYLIANGHKKIGFVGTVLATSSITDRYLGYMKAMMEHGLELKEEWRIDDRDLKSGKVDAEKYIVLPKEMPTAFFCNCDMIAGKLIAKLEKEGYKVPENISVVGYDNYIYPGVCDVEITSYRVDFQRMAKKVVDLMIRCLTKKEHVPGIHRVEGEIVIKNSAKKIG